MDKFCAYRIDKNGDQIFADFCNLNIDDLTEGDVVIKVMYSTINYKDALAATGKGKILKKYPLVGGIDLSGTVVSSSSDLVKEGLVSKTVDSMFAFIDTLNVPANKKKKYENMFDDDTVLSEVESAYSSSAFMNKVLWDKKKNQKRYSDDNK